MLELEQRANEFIAERSGSGENQAVELVRLFRDEIRRERAREIGRRAA